MTYLVKEVFFTLQGEGVNVGRPAVFCRFAGCNLWSGHERHRTSAICQFCDTDFVGTDGAGGGHFRSPDELADAVEREWTRFNADVQHRFVVVTGGEPLLQLDDAAMGALHDRGFRIAIETNGTLPVPSGIDWVCVSPKAGVPLVVCKGDELKLVFPQEELTPAELEHMEFEHFLLQPMDGPDRDRNTKLAIEHCISNPRWRLSLQTHKYLDIP